MLSVTSVDSGLSVKFVVSSGSSDSVVPSLSSVAIVVVGGAVVVAGQPS